MNDYVVYGLSVNDGPIRYVGLTNNIKSRKRQHRYNCDAGTKFPVYDWMRKYGFSNIAWTNLEECADIASLQKSEIWWISHYGIENLLNMRAGETGGGMTEKTRARMSEAQKGKVFSAETRQKMSEAKVGKPALTRKLTQQEAVEIRAYRGFLPSRVLAESYEINRCTIKRIWNSLSYIS